MGTIQPGEDASIMEKVKQRDHEARDVIIGCVVSFILMPVVGPFLYWFIRSVNELHTRQLALLHRLRDKVQENNELASQLADTMTSISVIKEEIAAYENRKRSANDA